MRAFVVPAVLTFVALSACEKVPLVDIEAGFPLADAVWFEDEHTLFVFYRAEAQQGIEPVSVIELKYRTDTEAVDWTVLQRFPPVHTHFSVDCGPRTRCGSWSLTLPEIPREIGLRLRYHPKGSLALSAQVAPYIVASGPAHLSRSLVAYGVFDGENKHVQWRVRHQFPNLRNHDVENLGLHRTWRVTNPFSGDVPVQPADNPYSYAVPDCSGTPLGWPERGSNNRAVFETTELPVVNGPDPTVCGTATVTDARGEFQAIATARKNPEVRSAFSTIRTPVKEARPVRFLLRPCNRSISDAHRAMQEQRLFLANEVSLCIDDLAAPGFAGALATRFKGALDTARTQGQDMVLSIALHHDDTTGTVASVVAEALSTVLVPERDKSTPRAVGAFVFDSYARTVMRPELRPLVLWCPAFIPRPGVDPIDLDLIPAASERSCPLIPDIPDVILGPIKFNAAPILPTRAQYLTFIEKYAEANAGKMTEQQFLAPERTAISVNVPLGEFGVASFFDNEVIFASPTDAFSYCGPGEGKPELNNVVFRVPLLPESVAPLGSLPDIHNMFAQPSYQLGIGWDSPFLMRLKYETSLAGQLQVFSLSAPFGLKSVDQRYYGNELWKSSAFDLSNVLLQCTRFCDFPVFDSEGIYNVLQPFRTTQANACYAPQFPRVFEPKESPRDP